MIFNCSHRAPTKPTAYAMATAKLAAEELCLEHGDRWTGPREKIFDMLVRAGGPVKAYEIISDYRDGEGLGNSGTVYDTLNYFVRRGLVQRVDTLKEFIVCSRPGAPADTLLICDCCGNVAEESMGLAAEVPNVALRHAFTVSGFALEVRGKCKLCAHPE